MASQAAVVRIRVLLIVVITLAGLAALLWARGRARFDNPDRAGEVSGLTPTSPSVQRSPTIPLVSSTTPSPSLGTQAVENTPSTESNQASRDLTQPGGFVGTLNLIIPVVGVRPDQLLDTFTDSRSEGRIHDAIDIPAPAGTPVIAAADGEIVKLSPSERGGTTIYQLSTDRKLVFYYAHLERYADGLSAGKFVKQGEVIAYVGDTGNAGTGNYHLHFSIAAIADARRYWEGTNINPYPLLRK